MPELEEAPKSYARRRREPVQETNVSSEGGDRDVATAAPCNDGGGGDVATAALSDDGGAQEVKKSLGDED